MRIDLDIQEAELIIEVLKKAKKDSLAKRVQKFLDLDNGSRKILPSKVDKLNHGEYNPQWGDRYYK